MGIIEEWGCSKSLFEATLPSIFDSLSSPPVWPRWLCETSGKAFNYYISSGVFRGLRAQGQCLTYTKANVHWRHTGHIHIWNIQSAQLRQHIFPLLPHIWWTLNFYPIESGKRERRRRIGRRKDDGEDLIIPFVCFVISRWELHNVGWWWGRGGGLLNGCHTKENERKSYTVHNDTLKGLVS